MPERGQVCAVPPSPHPAAAAAKPVGVWKAAKCLQNATFANAKGQSPSLRKESRFANTWQFSAAFFFAARVRKQFCKCGNGKTGCRMKKAFCKASFLYLMIWQQF